MPRDVGLNEAHAGEKRLHFPVSAPSHPRLAGRLPAFTRSEERQTNERVLLDRLPLPHVHSTNPLLVMCLDTSTPDNILSIRAERNAYHFH